MNNSKCSTKLMKNCNTGNSNKSPPYDKKIDFLTNHNASSIHSNSCYLGNTSVNYGYGGTINHNSRKSNCNANVTLSPNSKTSQIKKQLIGSQIKLYYPPQHNKKLKIRTMSQGAIVIHSKDNSVNRNKSQSQWNQKSSNASSMKVLPSCGIVKGNEKNYMGRLKLFEAVLKELVSKNNPKLNEEIEMIYHRIMRPGSHSRSQIDIQLQTKSIGKHLDEMNMNLTMNQKIQKINKESADLKALYLNKKPQDKDSNYPGNKMQSDLNEFKALFAKYNSKKKPVKQQLKKNNITATLSSNSIFKHTNAFIPTEVTHHNQNNHRRNVIDAYNDKDNDLLQIDTMELMAKYNIEDTKQLLYYQPKVKIRKHLKTNMPKLKLNMTDLRLDHHKPNGMPLAFEDSLNSINDKLPKDEIEFIYDGTLNEGFLMESEANLNQFSHSILSPIKKVTNE